MSYLLTFHFCPSFFGQVILDTTLHCVLATLFAFWQVFWSQIYLYSYWDNAAVWGDYVDLYSSLQITGAVHAYIFQTHIYGYKWVLLDLG